MPSNTHLQRGGETSPNLQWASAPTRSKAFALISGILTRTPCLIVGYAYVHWNVFGIPATAGALAQGASRKHAGRQREGLSDDRVARYSGPPPAGNGNHHSFTLYALNTSALGIDTRPGARRTSNASTSSSIVRRRWRCRPRPAAEARDAMRALRPRPHRRPCVAAGGGLARHPGWLRRKRCSTQPAHQHRRPGGHRGAPLTKQLDLYPASACRPPGISVLVMQDGVETYSSQRGMANNGLTRAITRHTGFRLASVSKPFTAVADDEAGRAGPAQAQRRLLDYLPGCRNTGAPSRWSTC